MGKCPRKIKRVTNHFTADCFRKDRLQRNRCYTQICMFKGEVPLGCRWRSATSPKSPNGRGRAFMWIMLFILGLSSYISVLQTSTPSQPFFLNTSQASYYQGPCTSGKCVCVCVLSAVAQESLKGFIKEWKVCGHLCRLAQQSLLSPAPYMPSYGQSQTLVSKTNTAPYRCGTVSATQSWQKKE